MSKSKDSGTRGTPQRLVVQTLESLAHSGVTHIPRGKFTPQPTEQKAAAPPSVSVSPPPQPQGSHPPTTAQPAQQTPSCAPRPSGAGASADDRTAALEIIRAEVAACTRCTELATTRRQTVFGSGNPTPRLVFMGEAPGADEDRQGVPFVGRAGQLLTKIIEACTLRRDDVYILNTLKCRPPENRTPLPHEAANCREYLDRQLQVLTPEFICCLGAVAAQNLLGTTSPIGRLRGRLHEYQGIRVLCTYHPAYLLRNPAAKKDCWQDMQLLMREMGIELPSSS